MNRLIENTKQNIHRIKAFGRNIYDCAHLIYGRNGFESIKCDKHIYSNENNKLVVEEYVKFINNNIDDIINYTAYDKIFVDGVIIFQR